MFRSLALGCAALFTAVSVTSSASATTGTVLFQPVLPNTNALVTNEFAYWNPTQFGARSSSDWDMTSGSLFSSVGAVAGVGSTGVVNSGSPDSSSSRVTNSAVFRLNTKRTDFGDVNVRLKLNIAELGTTPATPAVAWDGVHIWLRYQSQYSLYYASVARRDGHVVIKKKCPGGPSNSGTYYSIGAEVPGRPLPLNTWTYVSADVRNNPDGSVTIKLYQADQLLITATDAGVGCAPITQPGATGIRGDNARFRFHTFQVRRL